MTQKILITGAAGFIGFHLAKLFLEDGFQVLGFDGMTSYYDPELKEARLDILSKFNLFEFEKGMLEEEGILTELVSNFKPHLIVHLAAQAGVRYSIDEPRSYVNSNLVGTLELLEAARAHPPAHLMMASTSSVYGANDTMPYSEADQAVHPMSFYAATKIANEAMAHSYAHLYSIPTTIFRFFTVYGPFGRPDMALFKFTQAILERKPIDVYNYGKMKRDFTYVDDLTTSLKKLSQVPPVKGTSILSDTLSPVAPFRVVNIGNGEPKSLNDFIAAIEKALSLKSTKNLLPMQPGDVPETWADISVLEDLIGRIHHTPLDVGVSKFVDWYKAWSGTKLGF